MNKLLTKIFPKKPSYLKVGLFLLVFVFTFILRAHNYDRTPVAGHLDEQLYAWNGIYMIETGTPVSWSTLDYPKSAEVFKGKITYKGGDPWASVTLYKPNLDQPPLFSLIVGSFAHMYGADRNQYIPSSYIRMPVIFFSTVTSVVIFLIALEVSGFGVGILSMLLYGTIPTMVFASRTAMPESFISMLYVIVAYLLIRFIRNPRFLYIVFIPLLVGLAGLSKATGFFIIFIAMYLVFKKVYEDKGFKNAVLKSSYLFLAVIPFVVIFILYGLYYSPQIFWRLMDIQSHRPVGFNSLEWLFISPSFSTAIIKDSWFVFCLLSAAYFIFRPKEGMERLISLFLIFWFAVVMFTAGEGDLLAWYRFPSYPFLAIIGVWGLQLLVKRADIFSTFMAFGMMLGNRSLLVNAFKPNISAINFRLSFILIMLPSILHSVFNLSFLQKMNKALIVSLIAIGLYMNFMYIYNEFEIRCESISCAIVPSTFLSEIHFPFIWRWIVVNKPYQFTDFE